MRSLYEPIDHKKRAQKYREDALACDRAGYRGFAEINREMAAFLDPIVEEDMEQERAMADNWRRAA